jgi:hypothetical protein
VDVFGDRLRGRAIASPQLGDPASEARRVDATATVQSAVQTGTVINMSQAVSVALLVTLPDGATTPATTQLQVPMLSLARLKPGAQLAVTIDPQIPASVRVDWNG